MKQPNSITPKLTIMINMDNNEKQVYEHLCTNYGSLEKFFEMVVRERAKYEGIIHQQQSQLKSTISICEQYKALAEVYSDMSPPKFTWCWLKSKLTKNPVSV